MKEFHQTKDSSNREMRLYLKEVAKIPLLSPEEEKELAIRAKRGDRDAIQLLIESNLRFVIKVAKKYQKSGLPLLELINEGNVGLIEAARRFDPERQVRFTSYAVWWIRQRILHYIAEASQLFRMTPKTANIRYRIGAALNKRNGLEMPTREELAKEIGVTLNELNLSMEASPKSYSLDYPIYDGGDMMLSDVLEQHIVASPENLVAASSMKRQIDESLQSLTAMEQKILRLRFGLDDDNPQTLSKVGKQLNLSRERIRQIEMQALDKLRRSSASLSSYLN
jgi:RNA polymerase primary sigma factor